MFAFLFLINVYEISFYCSFYIDSPIFFFIRYEKERRIRVAIICGLARMAALMATTYRPYLGVGLGPFSVCT